MVEAGRIDDDLRRPRLQAATRTGEGSGLAPSGVCRTGAWSAAPTVVVVVTPSPATLPVLAFPLAG
jgi:hypothetical protein